MSQFHLSAELPGGDENREKRVEVMAKGFETALHHAATDPEIRLRMLMGDAYSKWRMFLDWFAVELGRESSEVRELAAKVVADPTSFLQGGGGATYPGRDTVLNTQLRLLSRVIASNSPDADADAGS